MNETLLTPPPSSSYTLNLDFTNITDLSSLKSMLLKADKNFILDETSTFNYDNGVSIRKGTGNVDSNSVTQSWIDSTHLLVFKDYPIPNIVKLKAHATQVTNARCFFSISIKIEKVFCLIFFCDAGNTISDNTDTRFGLMIDGFNMDGYKTTSTKNTIVQRMEPSLNIVDKTFDVSSFNNFKTFVGNNDKCDIIIHSMYYFREGGKNVINYPFYLEKVDIQF